MADEIRVDYEQLRLIASRFAAQANANHQTVQLVQRKVNQLQSAWMGRGSQAFFAEMTGVVLPAMGRLTEALRQARAVTLEISRIMAAAEDDAARPFRARENFDFDRFLDVAQPGFEWLDKLNTLLPIPAALALALGLRGGATYAGQVIVAAPQLLQNLGISGRMLKELAGVSPYLTHIKATNIVSHISKGVIGLDALISVGKGTLAVADVWHTRAAEYAGLDGSAAFSARAVDAGLAVLPVTTGFAGGVGGVLAGAKLGAMVGAFGGPVGIVAGGLIGSAIGGFAGDWIGDQLGNAAVGALNENVGRSNMIDWVDHSVAQPVADAVTGAWDAVGSWFAPQPVAP